MKIKIMLQRILTAGLCCMLLVGCSGGTKPSTIGPTQEQVGAEANAELLASVIKMLNELERYNELKIMQMVSGPVGEQAPDEKQTSTTIIRFAAPETLDTVVDRLNQWLDGRPADDNDGWQPTKLLDTLPAPAKKSLAIERAGERKFFRDSSGPGFGLHDGWALQQAIWLRDAAASHAGEQINPLERARRLFDWTIRNVQLASPNEPVSSGSMAKWSELPLLPWHTLLLGRGLAEHRLWVFTLLARQQGLDVVVLALPNADGSRREWAAGLLLDDQLYLFDPTIGLPIPSQSEKGIATLAEARKDPQVLAQLDLPNQPYGVKAADLAPGKVTALIEAGPAAIARRMRMLENHFAAGSRPILTADADRLAKRLTETPGLELAGVEAWDRPYKTVAELGRLGKAPLEQLQVMLLPFQGVATLWNARSLHLRGIYEGKSTGDDRTAHVYYLRVHTPDEIIETAKDPQTNLPFSAPQKRLFKVAKGHAAYWLALASYDQNDFTAAAKHLKKRVLDVQSEGQTDTQNPWTHGARYNLARSYEGQARALVAEKKPDEARLWFAKAAEALADPADADSPSRQGNLILARQLQALAKP